MKKRVTFVVCTNIFCLHFSSGAGVSHHFKIRMFPKTPDKKRAFFIDDSYQFERIEELIEHVKQYGIPLDNEVSTEAALY